MTKAQLLHDPETLHPAPYKYVRFARPDGREAVKVAEMDEECPAHRQMVPRGCRAISAGMLGICKTSWWFLSQSSMTLQIGSAPDDPELLCTLLKREHYHGYDRDESPKEEPTCSPSQST
jgi:hypothetical protein